MEPDKQDNTQIGKFTLGFFISLLLFLSLYKEKKMNEMSANKQNNNNITKLRCKKC